MIAAMSVERHREHVVQHEREAFGGESVSSTTSNAKPTESASSASCSGSSAVRRIDDRIRDVRSECLLAAGRTGAEHVQRHARDDGGQPRTEVLHDACVRSTEPQPRLLNGVISVAQRAEHPVSHRPQARPVLLELICQQFLVVHGHVPPLAWVIAVRPGGVLRCDMARDRETEGAGDASVRGRSEWWRSGTHLVPLLIGAGHEVIGTARSARAGGSDPCPGRRGGRARSDRAAAVRGVVRRASPDAIVHPATAIADARFGRASTTPSRRRSARTQGTDALLAGA